MNAEQPKQPPEGDNGTGGATSQAQISPLEAMVTRHHIKEWTKENLWWPGLTAFTATAVYTAGHFMLNEDPFYVSGELAGAGGLLLGVVMAASTTNRLSELRTEAGAILNRCDHRDVKDCQEQIEQGGEQLAFIGYISTFGSIAMAAAHVAVEHFLKDQTRMWYTIALVVASCIYVLGLTVYCRRCLFRAKTWVLFADLCRTGESLDEHLRRYPGAR